MVIEGRIRMTDNEWKEFERLNWAPWRPRTPAEFNAMCDLAIARHQVEDTDGLGEVYAIATAQMKFGPNGEVNFPADKRREAYVKVHGTWPNDEQLAAFDAGELPDPGTKPQLSIVPPVKP